MALITCPECGKQISDKAASCPGCGYPLDDNNIYIINGVTVDLKRLCDKYDGERNKIARELSELTDIGYGQSCDIVDDFTESDEMKEMVDARLSKKYREKRYQKERLEQFKRDKVAYCPKCHSTSISYGTKKLSIARAIIGNELAGHTGAVLGGLSSGKGYAVCLNCGKRWKL